MKLPDLFSESKTGKLKIWSIKAVNDEVIVVTGYAGFKQTTHTTKVIQKNIGKANETSVQQQAILEAKSKWNKKKDQGYYEKGETSMVILPMLAMDYNKRGKDINFPCFVQQKLDGVRAVFNGKRMYSRLGKEFKNLGHIIDAIKYTDYPLDGELYSDTLTFQEIVGIIKKEKLTIKDAEKIKMVSFTVYDVITPFDYVDRKKIIETLGKNKHVKILESEICKSPDDIEKFHDKYVKQGYEGLIIRNFKGKYEQKNRSKNLQKFKKFQDAEFEIVGFTQGIGVEAGLIIYECKTENGGLFSVRPSGTHTVRKAMFKNGNKYIGKMLTVKFFEYTDEGIPRFPTTMRGGEADMRID